MERKRITVKQFREMSNRDAFQFWMNQSWPFDMATTCNKCLTMHVSGCSSNHRKLQATVAEVFPEEFWVLSGARYGEQLQANASALFALRKKFDKLYRAPRRRPEGR